MLLGLLALLLLVAALVTVRAGGLGRPLDAWGARPTRTTYLFGAAIVLAANAPLALIAMPFTDLPTYGPGDARSHALIARAVAQGLPHGWTDVVQSGFAVGPHYPIVGWGLSALLIKAGVPALAAVDAVGLVAVLTVPVLVFILAHRAGAHVFPALIGALFLSWISPVNPVVGGYEAFYLYGVLSQVVALPSIVLLVFGVVRRGAPWRATLPAVVAMASHPQITTACIGALFLPVLAACNKSVLGRYVRASAAAIFLGAAMYGPGVATLKVPFGWPPLSSWRVSGFEAARLSGWLLDGDLIDMQRAPVLTIMWAAAMMMCLLRVARPAPRAVVIASVATVVLSMAGSKLSGIGPLGVFLISFFQPLRMLVLVPLAAAATVIVALAEAAPFARALVSHARARLAPHLRRRSWFMPMALGIATALFACVVLPSRFAWARESRTTLQSYRASAPCGASTPAGFEPTLVRRWLESLRDGRFWYEQETEAGNACGFAAGYELVSSVPVAVTLGMGVQVGVHVVAFHELAPQRTASSTRAEALGVRHLLLLDGAPAGEGWDIAQRTGTVTLARRRGGTDFVGLGCIVSRWTGSDASLRARLIADLKTPLGADRLLDPTSLIALETKGDGDVIEQRAEDLECRIAGAHLAEIPREPGAYEANVDAPSPVDVVFRAAAFPTWRVFVDGQVTPTTTVAPGFVSARLAPGKHHVEAVVSILPGYLRGIMLALLAAALCSLSSFASARAFLRRLTRARSS